MIMFFMINAIKCSIVKRRKIITIKHRISEGESHSIVYSSRIKTVLGLKHSAMQIYSSCNF